MQIATLQAEARQAGGTREARRVRRDGKVPGVIYGHGKTPENLAVPVRDLGNLIEQGAHLIELTIGSEKRQVLIKEVQFDHLGDVLVHVDFTHVDLTERVHVSVPLEFRGTPVGTHEGGRLEHGLMDIEVECVVTLIPESIRVNVGEMKVADVIHVRDLDLLEGMMAVTPAEMIVCTVRAAVAADVEDEGEGEGGESAEPEIIGRKEQPEDEA